MLKWNGCHGNTCVAMAIWLFPWQQTNYSTFIPCWNNCGITQEFLQYPTILPRWKNHLCTLCEIWNQSNEDKIRVMKIKSENWRSNQRGQDIRSEKWRCHHRNEDWKSEQWNKNFRNMDKISEMKTENLRCVDEIWEMIVKSVKWEYEFWECIIDFRNMFDF